MIEILAEQGSDEKHYERLKKLLATADGTVRIATAYITERELLSGRPRHEVRLLVPESITDIARGTISLHALASIIKTGLNGRFVPPLPKMHAKVYIFGKDVAVVSSANFTCLALHNNIEVGIEISGSKVQELIDWYDCLWARGRDITPQRLHQLGRDTAKLRQEFARLDRRLYQKSEEIAAWSRPPRAATRSARGIDALFGTARRFFVCNTNRRDGGLSPGGAFLCEERMVSRGFAAAWENFRFPAHMREVRQGHAIFAYAKGTGIIGVGRARGPCEQLPPGDRKRLHPGESTEWRIPVDWLDWRDADHACVWPSYNSTFWDVSSDGYAQARENVRRYFLRTGD